MHKCIYAYDRMKSNQVNGEKKTSNGHNFWSRKDIRKIKISKFILSIKRIDDGLNIHKSTTIYSNLVFGLIIKITENTKVMIIKYGR